METVVFMMRGVGQKGSVSPCLLEGQEECGDTGFVTPGAAHCSARCPITSPCRGACGEGEGARHRPLELGGSGQPPGLMQRGKLGSALGWEDFCPLPSPGMSASLPLQCGKPQSCPTAAVPLHLWGHLQTSQGWQPENGVQQSSPSPYLPNTFPAPSSSLLCSSSPPNPMSLRSGQAGGQGNVENSTSFFPDPVPITFSPSALLPGWPKARKG